MYPSDYYQNYNSQNAQNHPPNYSQSCPQDYTQSNTAESSQPYEGDHEAENEEEIENESEEEENEEVFEDIDSAVNVANEGENWIDGMEMIENIPDILENDEWVDVMVADEGDEEIDDVVLESEKSWVGRIFADKVKLNQAIREWSATHYSRRFQVEKSTKTQLRLICANEECSWRMCACQKKHDNYWTITKHTVNHTCTDVGDSTGQHHLTAEHICAMVIPNLREKITLTPTDVVDMVKHRYGFEITYKKAWHARNKAISRIYGRWEDSYAELPSYMRMLQTIDGNTVVEFQTSSVRGTGQHFERLFWALGASISGFRYCRPVVSIDGTFLHGKYLGCLLVATSLDANKGIFPVAFAVVEKETSFTWSWFLSRLKAYVTGDRHMCIITDRWRGHANVFNEIYPDREGHAYRYCIRHVQQNIVKRFHNKAVGEKFWTAATQRTTAGLEEKLAELEIMKAGVGEYLNTEVGRKELWAVAHDGGRRFGIATTNISECFNGILKGARGLPIRSLVAQICARLNTYFYKRRTEGEETNTEFPLKIENMVKNRKTASRNMQAVRHSHELFAVTCHNYRVSYADTFEVCLPLSENTNLSCSCGIPQSDGLACSHVIAACRLVGRNISSYCSVYYSVDYYRKTYEAVLPVPLHRRYWPVVDGQKMLEPIIEKRRAGRPATRRRRTEMDTGGRNSQICSYCGARGHVRETCAEYFLWRNQHN